MRLLERAKRIDRIRKVRAMWERSGFWRNHTTASHEFQLIDVLRDIRLMLTLIFLVLALSHCNQKPNVTVQLSDSGVAV